MHAMARSFDYIYFGDSAMPCLFIMSGASTTTWCGYQIVRTATGWYMSAWNPRAKIELRVKICNYNRIDRCGIITPRCLNFDIPFINRVLNGGILFWTPWPFVCLLEQLFGNYVHISEGCPLTLWILVLGQIASAMLVTVSIIIMMDNISKLVQREYGGDNRRTWSFLLYLLVNENNVGLMCNDIDDLI